MLDVALWVNWISVLVPAHERLGGIHQETQGYLHPTCSTCVAPSTVTLF